MTTNEEHLAFTKTAHHLKTLGYFKGIENASNLSSRGINALYETTIPNVRPRDRDEALQARDFLLEAERTGDLTKYANMARQWCGNNAAGLRNGDKSGRMSGRQQHSGRPATTMRFGEDEYDVVYEVKVTKTLVQTKVPPPCKDDGPREVLKKAQGAPVCRDDRGRKGLKKTQDTDACEEECEGKVQKKSRAPPACEDKCDRTVFRKSPATTACEDDCDRQTRGNAYKKRNRYTSACEDECGGGC